MTCDTLLFIYFSHLRLLLVTCTSCNMFSISFSVSTGFTCDKFREIVKLTGKISELDTLDTALDATSLVNSVHCSVPAEVEPVQQGNWVTVRRYSRGTKHCSSVPITTLNRFSPLSETPTENPVECALVIGGSITRNVNIETPATIVTCCKFVESLFSPF